MTKRRKGNKTIDLAATKKKRSPTQSTSTYFNPYDRVGVSPHYEASKAQTSIATPEMRRKQIKTHNKLTPAQLRRNKKRRRKRFMIKVLAVMSMTSLSVWGIVKVKDLLTKPKVSYQVVKTGTIDTSKSFEGIIIRNEKVYYSEEEGTVQYIVSEGEKVKKEGAVYAIVDDEQLTQTEAEKDKIANAVYNAADNRKEISYYQDQIYALNLEFKNRMEDFYASRYSSTTDYIYALRNQLDNNVVSRMDLYVQEQGDIDQGITTKIDAVNIDLEKYKMIKTAPVSGIVSYKVDGQEENLGIDKLETLDYEQYMAIIKNSQYEALNTSYINKNMPAYKLVLDNTWYIVSYLSEAEAENFVEGTSYDFDFEEISTGSIKFTLKSKKVEGKRVALVFETNSQVNAFLGTRRVQFSMGNKAETGLKIPLKAIVEQHLIKIPSTYKVERDNTVGVYRKKGEEVEFVKIVPQYEKEDYIYILQDIDDMNSLQVNNVLSHPIDNKPYTLNEVEVAEGVYVINGKIAQFKAVEIYLQNDDYALIKPNGKSELKERDKMISNPKSIKLDQLLDEMNIQNE